jgi:hypothetical protein
MIKIAIRNNLINRLNVHILKKEKFIYILESEYNFNNSDIIKTLLLDKIEIIIKRDILDIIICFMENVYYNVQPITYESLNKINIFIDESSNIKDLFIKIGIINHIL